MNTYTATVHKIETAAERSDYAVSRRNQRPDFVPAAIRTPWGLNAMECYVMQRTCEGKTAKEIARDCGRSHRTIELHKGGVRERMGVNSILLAALIYDRWARSTH